MTKTVFAGRRAIVTGAAQGIGRAIAERLHRWRCAGLLVGHGCRSGIRGGSGNG